MSDCVDCENGECEEVISSSDILFNGGFINVTFDPNATLNEVLLQMESYFNSLVINVSDPVFILGENCLDMAEGTYSFQEIIQGVIDKLCEVATQAGTGVTTNDVTLEDITLPDCLSAFTGTTSTELFNYIMSAFCEFVSSNPPDPIVDPIPGGGGSGFVLDTVRYKDFVNNYTVTNYHKGIVENDSYVFDHTTPTYSASNLNVTVQPMGAFVNNALIVRDDVVVFGLTANKWNYIKLSDTGLISLNVQNIGVVLPNPSDGFFLYRMVTDAIGVTALVNLFEDSAFNDPTFTIDPDSVETAMIQDDAITTAKLADVITATTKGHISVFTATVNDKGQVTSVDSNIDMTGVADGDILVYDNGSGGFIVGQRRNVVASTFLPLSNGTDYVTSSVKEVGAQVEVAKKLEINAGVIEDDTNAILNLVSTTKYFKPPVMTAAQASLITPDDGAMLYVTTTDATFTSIGFWGVEAGSWIKL